MIINPMTIEKKTKSGDDTKDPDSVLSNGFPPVSSRIEIRNLPTGIQLSLHIGLIPPILRKS